MAGIITDRTAFYRFSAPELWAQINPELGESLRLADRIRASIKIYNQAYPPPPPSWKSQLGTVIFAGACIAVLGAAYLSTSGVTATAATNGPAVAANVATSANTAATTAAVASGTAVETVAVGEAVGLAGKVAAVAGPIAKGITAATGDTTAEKLVNAAQIIEDSDSFTDGIVNLYKGSLQEKNGVVTAEGEADLRALAEREKTQYANYLRQQADAESGKPATEGPDYSKLIIPGIGILALILRGAN